MKRFIILFFSLLLISASISNAQCPPEIDCEVPPDDDGGGNSDCWLYNCRQVITAQGWNPDGSIWMRVCDSCTEACTPDPDGPIIIGPDRLSNCYYINKWGTASILKLDPNKLTASIDGAPIFLDDHVTATVSNDDYDIYVNNPDGSICGGTYAGEPGLYYWDCWYPW